MPWDQDSRADLVTASGQGVYDSPQPSLTWPDGELEARLRSRLDGLDLNYPLRRRAGVARAAVVSALGYTPPQVWRRVRPRIPAQDLDVVVVKAHNVQLWNDDVSPARRYAFLQVDESDRLVGVRVLRGAQLDQYGSGRRTRKRQALAPAAVAGTRLLSRTDTAVVSTLTGPVDLVTDGDALTHPGPGTVLPVAELHRRLAVLLGQPVPDLGVGQERRAGDAAHRAVSEVLGYAAAESGRCPDIPAQLVEVKFARRSTIDLGAADPSDAVGPVPGLAPLTFADLRYVILHAGCDGARCWRIIGVTVTTGGDFYRFFNPVRPGDSKLQFALPRDFFPNGLPVVVGRLARAAVRSARGPV